jgi:hypothetical protein
MQKRIGTIFHLNHFLRIIRLLFQDRIIRQATFLRRLPESQATMVYTYLKRFTVRVNTEFNLQVISDCENLQLSSRQGFRVEHH